MMNTTHAIAAFMDHAVIEIEDSEQRTKSIEDDDGNDNHDNEQVQLIQGPKMKKNLSSCNPVLLVLLTILFVTLCAAYVTFAYEQHHPLTGSRPSTGSWHIDFSSTHSAPVIAVVGMAPSDAHIPYKTTATAAAAAATSQLDQAKTINNPSENATNPITSPLFHPSKRIITIRDSHGVSYSVSEKTQTQWAHYRAGTGLILHLHITHHGGTTFCHQLGQAPYTDGAPPFACRADSDNAQSLLALNWTTEQASAFPIHNPWHYQDTARNIARVRRYFHFLSWEYWLQPPSDPPLRETNWEDPNLLSIVIMRDPISRLLAGDGWVAQEHRNVYRNNATEEEWWAFANSSVGHTDNFALRILAGKPCCRGKDTDPVFLEYAKALISRFSIVLDQECLDDGINAVANLLGIQLGPKRRRKRELQYVHPPNSERIPYKSVYDFLLERNRLDIKLYEWSKNISLVNCANLKQSLQIAITKKSDQQDLLTEPTLANDNLEVPHQPTIVTDPLYHPTKASTSIESADKSTSYSVSKLAKTQLESYKNGTGLILHIHITHHGGTTFCSAVGQATNTIGAPPFACTLATQFAREKLDFIPDPEFPMQDPWQYMETARNIAQIRRRFHFLSWEYYFEAPFPPLRETNWEDPNLVSVIIMRDPIERLLAGDGWVASEHRNVYYNNASEAEWWAFANDTTRNHTDNFALRILAGQLCCNGKDTERRFLDYAKALVSRFTVILDQACLDESMAALTDILGIQLDSETERFRRQYKQPPVETRIPYRDVYKFLLERNRFDIELYEWSKNISLVDCGSSKRQ